MAGKKKSSSSDGAAIKLFAEMRAIAGFREYELKRPKISRVTDCIMEFDEVRGTILIIKGGKVLLRVNNARIVRGQPMIEVWAEERRMKS